LEGKEKYFLDIFMVMDYRSGVWIGIPVENIQFEKKNFLIEN
jgi:hypothetical protein